MSADEGDKGWQKRLGPATAICIKDANRVVGYQNRLCQEICGDQTGLACNKGCMELYSAHRPYCFDSDGVFVFNNHDMDGRKIDVVVINDNGSLVTLLYVLGQKLQARADLLDSQGLTKREMEIALLIMNGATNAEVCDRLCISRATIKTHLNNIYKKLPSPAGQDLVRAGAGSRARRILNDLRHRLRRGER